MKKTFKLTFLGVATALVATTLFSCNQRKTIDISTGYFCIGNDQKGTSEFDGRLNLLYDVDDAYYSLIGIIAVKDSNKIIKEIPVSDMTISNKTGYKITTTSDGIFAVDEPGEYLIKVKHDSLEDNQVAGVVVSYVEKSLTSSAIFNLDLSDNNRFVTFSFKSPNKGRPIIVDGAKYIDPSFTPTIYGTTISENGTINPYFEVPLIRNLTPGSSFCYYSAPDDGKNYDFTGEGNLYVTLKVTGLDDTKHVLEITSVNNLSANNNDIKLDANESAFFTHTIKNKTANDSDVRSCYGYGYQDSEKLIVNSYVPYAVYDLSTLELLSNPYIPTTYKIKPTTKEVLIQFKNTFSSIGDEIHITKIFDGENIDLSGIRGTVATKGVNINLGATKLNQCIGKASRIYNVYNDTTSKYTESMFSLEATLGIDYGTPFVFTIALNKKYISLFSEIQLKLNYYTNFLIFDVPHTVNINVTLNDFELINYDETKGEYTFGISSLDLYSLAGLIQKDSDLEKYKISSIEVDAINVVFNEFTMPVESVDVAHFELNFKS